MKSSDIATPTLGEMLLRVLSARGQSRPARTVELFGWYDLGLGVLILTAPMFVASLLNLPTLNWQAANYVRLVGLLVSGLGLLYVVSGRLDSRGFIFASLVDRPMVPVIMALLWYLGVLPGALALAFSISDFGGFLWTLSAWRAERPDDGIAAAIFGFVSGVVRNSRTFHPDGRMFLGTVRSLEPLEADLAKAAGQLAGSTVLLRMGMGLLKRGMPRWLAKVVPDAPSIAGRFFSPAMPGEIRLERHPADDLDLLCTAGGDRLWKLVLNLATGGMGYGLHRFDYFQNIYFAEVPYRVDGSGLKIWIRLVPDRDVSETPNDAQGREEALTRAVARQAAIRMQAQRAGGGEREPFVPFAEIRFEEEIELDQEALHFDPVAGRGFTPYGFLTRLRKSVYPASVHSRAATKLERERRESESLGPRLKRFVNQGPITPLEGGDSAMSVPLENGARPRRWLRRLRIACLAFVAALLLAGLYLGFRLTRDKPVDYADIVQHFKHGSTGGERTMGIPYWFWVALPELFPEYLPDGKAGRGYQSFGMIYENGEDPRYGLPVGVSMRNVRGIDVVYLNCAVCHTGTVRDAPGAEPMVVAGMPANTLDLGAFEKFLTSIPRDQKFIPQRMLDQIDAMADDPHRKIDKPDLINRLIFQYYAVHLMREKMLMLSQRLSFIHTETWGPGRVDTFNAPKALLNFRLDKLEPGELMGNADFPSIWNQKPREGMKLHWDGNNTSVNERNLSAAFGTGAYPPTLDADRVLRTANWLLTAKPPGYKYPIDSTLVQQGAPIYKQYCEGCHGTRDAPFRSDPPRKDELVGTVVPIGEIGTDPSRLNSYTYLVAANQGTLYAGYEREWGFNKDYPARFSHFHKTQGYANMPLDGIWLRAPYLHNGSVPNVRELLEPAAKRTKTFYRGNDVYDRENVGFASDVAEQGGKRFFAFNTADKGNGNQGHEGKAYGTDLPDADKRALLEYLKTF